MIERWTFAVLEVEGWAPNQNRAENPRPVALVVGAGIQDSLLATFKSGLYCNNVVVRLYRAGVDLQLVMVQEGRFRVTTEAAIKAGDRAGQPVHCMPVGLAKDFPGIVDTVVQVGESLIMYSMPADEVAHFLQWGSE